MFIEECKRLILSSIPNKLPDDSSIFSKLSELLEVIIDNCPDIYHDELVKFTNTQIMKRRELK